MENTGKTRIITPSRSEGDGMENSSFGEVDSVKHWSAIHSQKSPINYYHKNFVPAQGKSKEPKFVPYEPYKAAVSPIVPAFEQKSPAKFVIDSQKVNSLASSIIKLYSDLEGKGISLETSEGQKCSSECSHKVKLLEDRISVLEKENKELMSQYQVQNEVNADLKKMLVASLGEDVQLKVQFMTEDKAHLGKEVLRLSEEVDIVREETEKLAVQCDIWESKFKASSVMVMELAQWKSSLSFKLNQSVESLDALMQEHEELFKMLCTAHSKLECTLAAFDPGAKNVSRKNIPPKSISQLALDLKSLSNKIQERLLGKLFCDSNCYTEPKCLRQLTRTENLVNQFLKSFEQTSTRTGIDGTKCAPGMVACQILPHVCRADTSANFCKHCSGEVKYL